MELSHKTEKICTNEKFQEVKNSSTKVSGTCKVSEMYTMMSQFLL